MILDRIGEAHTLDDDVTVFAEGRALHGEGGRGTSAGLLRNIVDESGNDGGLGRGGSGAYLLEVVVVLLVVGHGDESE